MAASTKQLFITGASGYVGSVLTQFAITQGYTVHGLSRSEAADEKLRTLGAVPVRGDLTSLDVIRRECASADAVIALASVYGVASQSYEEAWEVEGPSFDAMADGLAGSDKPLVMTSGTLVVAPDPEGSETNEESPLNPNPLNNRFMAEQYVLKFADKGIRAISIRLAPYVYGRGGSGVARFMGMGVKKGEIPSVEGGKNHTSNVHVDDAARLFLLAVEKGNAGEIYNGSAATDITAGEIFSAISNAIEVPVKSKSHEEAKGEYGKMLAGFLKGENRASGDKAKKELGWQPQELGILEEINNGSYQKVAAGLR